MKIEKKIFDKILKGDSFSIAGGELVVKPKLAKVLGGVSIYNIVLERNGTDEPDLSFDNMDQLLEFGRYNPDGVSLRICAGCGDIPEGGYYINNDTGEEYCCYNCLLTAMNDMYGIGGWSTMIGESDTFQAWIKISKQEADFLENYRKINNEYWKKASIEYVCPFNQRDEEKECFENIEFTEVDDVLFQHKNNIQ